MSPKKEEKHMSYVDGFVLPIPKQKAAAYRKQARLAAKLWMEHGALSFFECIGDDVKPGKLTSFPQAVQLKDDEVPWFSWIVFASKKERNRINRSQRRQQNRRLVGNSEALTASCQDSHAVARLKNLLDGRCCLNDDVLAIIDHEQ